MNAIACSPLSKRLNRDIEIGLMYQRAEKHWTDGELRTAFRLFLAVAKGGFVPAYDTVAHFYDHGWGIKRNHDAALNWYRRAYECKESWNKRATRQARSIPANNIGCILRDRREFSRAILWFERAVKLGDGDANLNIADIYLHYKPDQKKAIYYLRKTVKASYVTDGSIEEARHLLNQLQKTKSASVRLKHPQHTRVSSRSSAA